MSKDDHEVGHDRSSVHHKRRLKQFYYAARLFVLAITLLSAQISPPFDTSADILLQQNSWLSVLSNVLLRWDSFHFASIALKGYVYEHQFAFMPGTPLVMRLFGELVWRTRRLLGASDGVVIEDVLMGGSMAAALMCDWTSDLYE
ncbi:ER membrane glycoprotein subunit of the GPI transamidase complex-like protein [Tulasnella sp. 419]|nr:ER membrane glycoprotein subunit of the GPI transamidase complex-like protein [Tulasnella sp. 419]